MSSTITGPPTYSFSYHEQQLTVHGHLYSQDFQPIGMHRIPDAITQAMDAVAQVTFESNLGGMYSDGLYGTEIIDAIDLSQLQ